MLCDVFSLFYLNFSILLNSNYKYEGGNGK